MAAARIFHAETVDDTLIVTPHGNISALEGEQVTFELQTLLEELGDRAPRNVVIDFQQTTYFGTSMLGAMHAFWRLARQGNGRMAVCNLSDVGRQILRVSRFDTIWPVCESMAEAMQEVRGMRDEG